jgi:two-component system, cell cycle sensor histidine kinase and response regulator CckA
LNLITNAAEAVGDKSGLVTIRTGIMKADQEYLSTLNWHPEPPEGVYAYLEVSDTGCGMTQDVQDKIFDPFFTTKFTGRGLGLAAVQGIVRGHKGAIQVHSEPGKGSTFKILFPCAEQTLPAIANQPAPEPIRCGVGQTVLVVDDEEIVRNVTNTLLKKGGYSVLTAEDGEEALRLLGARPQDIDVVLLDLSMPKMDGIETFDRMREICKHLPIILSSGYNEQDATRAFAGKGLSGFIQKPYRIEELLKKITDACNSMPRMQASSEPRTHSRVENNRVELGRPKSPDPDVFGPDAAE